MIYYFRPKEYDFLSKVYCYGLLFISLKIGVKYLLLVNYFIFYFNNFGYSIIFGYSLIIELGFEEDLEILIDFN